MGRAKIQTALMGIILIQVYLNILRSLTNIQGANARHACEYFFDKFFLYKIIYLYLHIWIIFTIHFQL